MYDKNNLNEFLKLLPRFNAYFKDGVFVVENPSENGKLIWVYDLVNVFELNDFMIVSTKEPTEK